MKSSTLKVTYKVEISSFRTCIRRLNNSLSCNAVTVVRSSGRVPAHFGCASGRRRLGMAAAALQLSCAFARFTAQNPARLCTYVMCHGPCVHSLHYILHNKYMCSCMNMMLLISDVEQSRNLLAKRLLSELTYDIMDKYWCSKLLLTENLPSRCSEKVLCLYRYSGIDISVLTEFKSGLSLL